MDAVRTIHVFHERAVPEADGEEAEKGSWHEDDIPIDLLAGHKRRGLGIADVAANVLLNAGASSPSRPSFLPNVCYVTAWETVSRATGEEERRVYRLSGFTPDEKKAIFERVVRRARR
jgi:hypothetical protein